MRVLRLGTALLAVAVFSVSWTATAHTHAQPAVGLDDERPRADASDAPEWYGWQTLIADGVSLALTPVGVGVFGFWLATPVVHAGHGHWGTAAGSVAIRMTVTVIPALLWMSSCFDIGLSGGGSGSGSRAVCDGLTALLVGGVIGAVVLDAAAFAYDPPERRARAGMQFAPWARTSDGSAEAGLRLAGYF